MSVLSTLLLVQPDPGVRAALQFGFEREGIEVVVAEGDRLAAAIARTRPQLVIAGETLETLGALRAALAAIELDSPVLCLATGVPRDQALAEGASEVVEAPAYLRDVVTLGRLAVSHDGGRLADHAGLYYLVRALATARKTCVLTLSRDLRRGELRFHDGEVTSAQGGQLHGVAALHQLLLWTDARFELRTEEVVPRRQIPLSIAELLASCERFLEEVRDVGCGLSPVHVYEQSREVNAALLADLPPAIAWILRLFDGSRTLADVIDDSPYRMFETLRVASRLRSIGLIGRPSSRGEAGDRQPSIDQWLGGLESRVEEAGEPIEWSDVLPRPAPAIEPEAISQVVPATSATGELETGGAGASGERDPEQTIIVDGETED